MKHIQIILLGLLLWLNGFKKVCAVANRKSAVWLTTVAILTASMPGVEATDPVVSSVKAAQRQGTKLVDIHYDVADADGNALLITVDVSDDGGATYEVPAESFSGDVHGGIPPGVGKLIVWDVGTDWDGNFSANMRFRVTANNLSSE